MAMVCVSGARECDGCMKCRSSDTALTCNGCGQDIFYGYDYYDVSGEPYCTECVQPKTAEMEE